MAKLIIKVPGAPVGEVELQPGVHRIGRSLNTDCQIAHPSVSNSHCEVTIGEEWAQIKDLGSTNGTWADGRRVEQITLAPGQSARLGEVEITYAPPPDPAAANSGLRLAVAPEMVAPVTPVCRPEARMVLPKIARRQTNFYKTIPGAFAYPFRRNGTALLLGGTLIFGVLDAVLSARVGGIVLAGGLAGLFLTFFLFGYVFEFLQSIITTTAFGEAEMPNWPPYDGWWDSAVAPFFRWAAILSCCLAPFFGWVRQKGSDDWGVALLFFVAGIAYYPMALLAVAMNDTTVAMNPVLVVTSIARVPKEYTVTCILFVVLSALLLVGPALFSILQAPLVGIVISEFLFLYFSAVEMRLIGLLYYTRRERFGWRF